MKDYFTFAMQSILHRKLRSWLTIIGIIIGIGAIVALISVSQGLENAITEQFKQIGSNKIFVFPSGSTTFVASNDELGLTVDDVDNLEGITELDFISSFLWMKREVTFGNEEKYTGITGIESGEELPRVFGESWGMELTRGRWFEESESNVAVIGIELAEEAFKKDIFINNKIEINGTKFQVVGILPRFGNAEDDNNIWITMDDARELLDAPRTVTFLELAVQEGKDIDAVALEAERILKKTRDEEDMDVVTPEQILGQLGGILDILQVVLGGIAAIALLVGGIGIMNAMFTNVLERKKEIGIMKAIGATPKDIQGMFLVESGIIGGVGGILGALLGTLIALGVGQAASNAGFILLKIQVEYGVITFAVLFAFFVGLGSGYLPAREASKMIPMEAIRE